MKASQHHEDDPTHHLHPSMLCHALPPGLVIIMCVIARAVFQTSAGFVVSLRTLNFFGLYIWENTSQIPVDWHSAKISWSLLWLSACGCRCLVLWPLPGLKWEIKTICTNQKCLNLKISSQRGWLYVVYASYRSIQGNLLLGSEIPLGPSE